MAKDQTPKEEVIAQKDTIEVVDTSKDQPEVIPQPKPTTFEEGISDYLIFLQAMRTKKRHVTSAPTFTPKNFYDQIQFYDTGGVRRLYVYINSAWRYVVLL